MWCSSFGENLPHVTMVGYDGHRSNMEQALPQLCCTSTTELENKSGQILKLRECEATFDIYVTFQEHAITTADE